MLYKHKQCKVNGFSFCVCIIYLTLKEKRATVLWKLSLKRKDKSESTANLRLCPALTAIILDILYFGPPVTLHCY